MATRKIIENYEDNPETEMTQGENYVLAIGIDEYVHFPKLHNAVKDVEAFIKLITEQYQFDNQRVTRLYNAEATRRNIIKSLRILAQDIKENDSLIIYFAGHGEQDTVGKHGYWIPVDAEKGQYGDFINNAEIIIWLDAMRVRHLFLISDACFSGTLFDDAKRRKNRSDEKLPSRWLLTSGGRMELASDGKKKVYSPFTIELLSILKRKRSTLLDMKELSNKIAKKIANNEQPMPISTALRGHKGGLFCFRNNEVKAWDNALKINTIEIYQTFIEEYPLSSHVPKAQENCAYLNAKDFDNIGILDNFLKTYPTSIFHDGIFDKLEKLKIQQAWEELCSKQVPSISDYKIFQNNFDNNKYFSNYKDLIFDKLEKLKIQQAWEELCSKQVPSISDCEDFKRKFRDSNYFSEYENLVSDKLEKINIEKAWNKCYTRTACLDFQNNFRNNKYFSNYKDLIFDKLEKLKIKQAWDNTLKNNTIEIYQTFIKEYPLSSYIGEAKERCAYLNARDSQDFSVLRNFVVTYPKSIFYSEIFDKLDELLMKRARKKRFTYHTYEETNIQKEWCKCSNRSDYINFQNTFINNKYFRRYEDLCKERIKEFDKHKSGNTQEKANSHTRATQTSSQNTFKGEEIKSIEQSKIVQSQNTRPETPITKTPKVIEWLPFEPEMVFVKGGTFTMGEGNETQKVSLNDYYIGKYPLTFEEYDIFCEDTKTTKPGDGCWGRGKRPVINISWHDAVRYCEWLSKKTNKNYGLPTEAQWEFAARGGTLSKGFEYSGANNLDEVGWFRENSGYKKLSVRYWDITKNNCQTHPVGQKYRNELGIFDMSGNVLEWCKDWHGAYNSNGSQPPHDPIGAVNGTNRVIRGGSWHNLAQHCRPTYRHDRPPAEGSNVLGFRLCIFPV